MNQKFPESFEVLSHLVKRLIKACAQAPHSEPAAAEYMTMVHEIAENENRLKGVLELIGKDIFSILEAMPSGEDSHTKIVLEFTYEPEIHESMLADWLLAISEDAADEFYGLIELLPDEDHDTITSFMFTLMTFYVNFIQDQT